MSHGNKIKEVVDYTEEDVLYSKGFELEILETKPIPGIDGYLVSKNGRVFEDDDFLTELRQYKNGSGYCCTSLRRSLITDWNIINPRALVHRLVALTFVDGYKEGFVVDHIDRDKTNNHADNLRWVTSSVNSARAIRVKRFSRGAKREFWCYCRNIVTGEIKEFSSRSDASRLLATEQYLTRILSNEMLFHRQHGVLFNGKWEVSLYKDKWDYEHINTPRTPGFVIITIRDSDNRVVDVLFNFVEFYRKYSLWNYYEKGVHAHQSMLKKFNSLYPELNVSYNYEEKPNPNTLFKVQEKPTVCSKKIVQIDSVSGTTKVFKSFRKASKELKMCRKQLSRLIDKDILYKKRYFFKYQ
jgi:NUMOD4 motif./HNH endonuclease.|nr:MAG TPA: homing endonuclease [Caudoviricetes sp.]